MTLIDNKNIYELVFYLNNTLRTTQNKNKNGEVFTPLNIINDILEKLNNHYISNHNHSIFENETLTWYDPSCGIGNFQICIYYKLFKGLENKFTNEKERKEHILNNMLYVNDINEENIQIYKAIFGDSQNANIHIGDALNLDIKKVFNKDKFNVILTNPPFNEETKNGNQNSKNIYNQLIYYYEGKCDYLSFIIPSRWFINNSLFASKLKNFFLSKNLIYIQHFETALEIFKSVSITGGINYFLIDNTQEKTTDNILFNDNLINIKKYDVIIDLKFHSIIDKILKQSTQFLDKLYVNLDYIESNDKRLTIFNHKNDIKCLVSTKQSKNNFLYFDKSYLTKDYNFIKVAITKIAYNNKFNKGFVLNENEISNRSYLIFKVDNLTHAENLKQYLSLDLTSFLMAVRKSGRNINKDTLQYIPLIDFNIKWTNEKLYEYFNINENEIQIIQNFINLAVC